MALQFRRGTEAQRAGTGITPASGELIHCTDSGAWYAGDGVTTGGRAMPGAIGQQAVTAPAADGVMLFDGATQRWVAGPLGFGDVQGLSDAAAIDGDALIWSTAGSAYGPGLALPPGTRPIVVAPPVPAIPAGLRLYLSGDGATGVVSTLANGVPGSITITPSATGGTIERSAPVGAFAQALTTVDMTAGAIICAGGTSPGAGAFTVKLRAFVPSGAPSDSGYLFTFDGDHGPYINGEGLLRWWAETDWAGAQFSFPVDEWCELAFCRSAGTLRALVNGVVAMTTSYSAALTFPLRIANDTSESASFPGRFVFEEFQFWSTAQHTSGYTPAAGPLDLADPAPLPTSARPGTLWTRGPVSDGLFLCTAAGPPATWERIAYASELPPP